MEPREAAGRCCCLTPIGHGALMSPSVDEGKSEPDCRRGDDPEALVVAVDVVVRMVPAYAEGVRRHGTGRCCAQPRCGSPPSSGAAARRRCAGLFSLIVAQVIVIVVRSTIRCRP